MKEKNISNRSARLLSYLMERDKECFDLKDASEALPHTSYSALKELLSAMTKRGLLMRVKRGTYFIIPYEEDPTSYIPNWHLLAEALVKNEPHYIAYYSALQIHELITQASLLEQVVVAKQVTPSARTIKGVRFQFIYHKPDRFFGWKKKWIDPYHRVHCSDLEKTFVDCLLAPAKGGGIVEIAKALAQAKDRIDHDKFLNYIRRIGSQAVIKRAGFLLEVFGLHTPDMISELRSMMTPSSVLLDPELPPKGKWVGRWHILQNLDMDTLYSSLGT